MDKSKEIIETRDKGGIVGSKQFKEKNDFQGPSSEFGKYGENLILPPVSS